MGPATTGSDVLDHLATTRTQMVAKRLDVPPLNFPGTMKIGFVVSPTPTKVVNTVKSGSEHDHVKDHQALLLNDPPPPNFHGKMKIDFVISQTPTKKDVQKSLVQECNVVTNYNNFSGAYDCMMGNSDPYSYLSGLRERFE